MPLEKIELNKWQNLETLTPNKRQNVIDKIFKNHEITALRAQKQIDLAHTVSTKTQNVISASKKTAGEFDSNI